jgi:DMSO/TMAO reductase YedYZ molybdopterin-dependent catalytic subunit
MTDRNEKKQERARALAAAGKGLFAGETPRGTGPVNRHGMPTVPPGQTVVSKWPVLDLGDKPFVTTENWSLTVRGLVDRPTTLRWADFLALPQVEDSSDFHCVTTWSKLNNRWRGVRFADLMSHVGVQPEAQFVLATAFDRDVSSGEYYSTNVSLTDAMSPDVLLVHEWEGKPLPHEHGGPVRMITPRLYAWKGAKWIKELVLLAEDQLGFWERRGYSNSAIPWFDDRFSRR